MNKNLYKLVGKRIRITGPYLASESFYGTVMEVRGSYIYLDSQGSAFDMDPEGFVGLNGGYSITVME